LALERSGELCGGLLSSEEVFFDELNFIEVPTFEEMVCQMGGEKGLPIWRVLGFSIVIMVFGFYILSYYSIVAHITVRLLASPSWGLKFQGFLTVVIYHILGGLSFMSYIKTTFIDPGYVSSSLLVCFSAFFSSYQKAANDLNQEKTERYCQKCEVPKPPRSHHCSICDRCVLRMDHVIYLLSFSNSPPYHHHIIIIFIRLTNEALSLGQ
jgi:hypothetical protein